MEIVEPAEPVQVERHSSIYQHRGMLAVRRGDEWVPIAFDALDGIVCGEVKSHKAVLTTKPYIGYSFPVKECRYVEEQYLVADQSGTELRLLPEAYGSGFYEARREGKMAVNSDCGALGVTNDTTLRVGMDYVLATETAEAID